MIPATLGQTRILGVYWTLEIELLFYALCLALYVTRWLDRQEVLAAIILLLVWTGKLLRLTDDLARHASGPVALSIHCLHRSLAVMFWGAPVSDGLR